MRRRLGAGLGAGVTAVVLLTASCTSGHEPGRAGRVVGKDRDYECKTTGAGKKARQSCRWEYELTVRTKTGEHHEIEVPSYVYTDCRRGSAYPACINR